MVPSGVRTLDQDLQQQRVVRQLKHAWFHLRTLQRGRFGGGGQVPNRRAHVLRHHTDCITAKQVCQL